MQGKRCLIIAGGELGQSESLRRLLPPTEYTIAADGGARHAKTLGLIPQIVLGDFDTLTEPELAELARQGTALEKYPREKDFSDTHLAILKALELGFTDLVIIAALGGRLDHTLANIMLLALPEARGHNLCIMDTNQEIRLIEKSLVIEGQPGTIVSLLPLSDEVSGVTTQGLQYQVPHNTFRLGIPNGISNVMTERQAVVEIEAGLLLAIITQTKGE